MFVRASPARFLTSFFFCLVRFVTAAVWLVTELVVGVRDFFFLFVRYVFLSGGLMDVALVLF